MLPGAHALTAYVQSFVETSSWLSPPVSICRCYRCSVKPHWLWVLMKASIRRYTVVRLSMQCANCGTWKQLPAPTRPELRAASSACTIEVTVFVTLGPVPYALSSALMQLRRCCRVADVTPSLVLDCVPWPTLCSFLAQVECCKCCPLATRLSGSGARSVGCMVAACSVCL